MRYVCEISDGKLKRVRCETLEVDQWKVRDFEVLLRNMTLEDAGVGIEEVEDGG